MSRPVLERSRMDRAVPLMAMSVVATLLASCFLQPVSAVAFRPFADSSPWNVPAEQKGYVEQYAPYADQLGAPGVPLSISGIPPDSAYAKPIYFAQPGDPTTANLTLTTSWSPNGDLRWDGNPIPIPAGVAPAPGSDGHLAIVSADQRTAWEFWQCTSIGPGGITAGVIAQWDLTGTGYSGRLLQSAARASGTPIVSTTIRAEDAINGIQHALGLSVPRVASEYVYPVASNSDGLLGPNAIEYGMLFILRSDFALPADASLGERNVVEALKTYGAYVVDQGATFELDADSTHPELWQQAGLASGSLERLGILPTDFRLVMTPPSPLVFEAESMTRSTSTDAIQLLSDPEASGNEAVSLRQSPTYLSQAYTSAYSADLVTLRMRGDQCDGAPQAVLTVDGSPFPPIDVASTSYADYTVPLSEANGGAPGAHVLEVEYLNNFKTDTCDRNLYLDKVTITRLAPPPDTTPPGGYPRPRGATPIRAPLVPAYQQCSTGGLSHGPPLSFPSCTPPQQASSFLTVGTPDANGAGAGELGAVLYSVRVSAPPIPSDVLIDVNTTDVRCQATEAACGSANAADGPDYTGQLQATARLRLTDRLNGTGGADPGTAQDFPLSFTVPCAATVDSSIGSTCSVSTSMDAVTPGAVTAGSRAIWEVGHVQVKDGGANGVAGSPDATLFLDEGVFVP